MKRFLTLFFLLGSLGAWAQPTPAHVLVNGIPLVFSPTVTTTPENLNGTVMVPAAFVFQRLGFTVTYNSSTREISASKPKPGGIGTYSLRFRTGNTTVNVNGRDSIMSVAPYLKNDRAMVPSRLVAHVANLIVEFDHETQSVQYYYYDELDAGLYFIDAQDDTYLDVAGARKLVPGIPTRFYDPSKPTIIYVHGNQPGAIAAKTREDLIHKVDKINTQNGWKARGWNVAIFHWEQLADDVVPSIGQPVPLFSERKIHTADRTFQLYRDTHYNFEVSLNFPGTRWRRSDNSFSPLEDWSKPVVDIFLDEYFKLFPASSSAPMPQVELVGNSLGGQLVMAAVAKMKFVKDYQPATGPSRMPSRITLMDPYWSQAAGNLIQGSTFHPNRPNVSFVDFVGASTLQQAVGKMMTMDGGTGRTLRDIPTTYYRTSILGFAGTSNELASKVAFVELKPRYVVRPNEQVNLIEESIRKHTWPVASYFASINCGYVRSTGLEVAVSSTGALVNTPDEVGRTGNYRFNACGGPGPGNQVGGALLSDEAIAAMMKLYPDGSGNGPMSTRRWSQIEIENARYFWEMYAYRYSVTAPTPPAPAARSAAAQPGTTPAMPLEMSFSPNPTNGPLQLSYTLPAAGTVEVQISDLLGRVRQTLRSEGSEFAGAHSLQADLSTLPAGTYIITYSLDGKKLHTSKILKGE
ncbi:hypothetical protein GCM10023185_34050 [Hymenobacter saemangeumensis]|uniref:T9SS type A sorting domain-containing protein n=1 Tax=Hymenobacter saemangeumensis TaxID=1084522 RepID=A0ABP8IPD3_9BACT